MLRLSTFLDLSFSNRLDLSLTQYDYVYDFFNNLASLEIDKPYANNLYNGIRDLTVITKQNILNTPSGKKDTLSFITGWLQPSIQPLNLDEYYSQIAAVINCDVTITAEKTKDKLLKPYNELKYEKFLCEALRFAINRNNIDIKDKIPASEMEFVFETNKKCAQCGVDLVVKKNKTIAYKYGIVQIFPEGLPPLKYSAFDSIRSKPHDYNHSSNKICLCTNHADEYESNPSPSVFQILIDKKKYYSEIAETDSSLEKAMLDEDLVTVLQNLKNIKSFDEIADFRIVPLELKEKIEENEPLRLAIKNDVDYYYNYIRSQLSDLDDTGSEFKIIGSQFEICYQKLAKIMKDQEEIYHRIINWVLKELRLPEKYKTAGRIIVSFFVQNCEVFDEIPKQSNTI